MEQRDGKPITFLGNAHLKATDMQLYLELWKDKEKYDEAVQFVPPTNTTWLLHKGSTYFFRSPTSGGRGSYYFFEKGSYILTDGVFSVLFNPTNDGTFYNITVYRNA